MTNSADQVEVDQSASDVIVQGIADVAAGTKSIDELRDEVRAMRSKARLTSVGS